jgi:hypothetical protein
MRDTLGADARLARADGILSRRLLDGIMLLTPDSGEPLRISQPGAVIWQLLDEPRTITDLVATLAKLYGVDAVVIDSDVRPILQILADYGALSITSRS